ncbi:low-affinity Zn(2+) transporter ZRT2 KNAG_0G02460 [Huiozyma naganishii CBS 8797]|uniref:Uncharacterized protein n=1 Tax=Huiozyma naganishii (strain ATCC MYA-139 / BCRC 22969 / CBS 8797 / KCTC 17520 / NBRC 10181 / NCYC 3082 / Yp74L-3) TaxID=1071383 RepID=J7RNV4_HUIN7|nr:hypothetical protein KNAG_0G02460 [Kazachstania naganishii CBS 8797]CCK71303.1 hypothetical protein KNAG_0G02460 [Kazachstania naganishii CBS 8797]
MLDLAFAALLPRDDDDVVACAVSNSYNGHNGLRILAVFIILISSGVGVFFPIMASRYSFIRLPDWCFFIAKFFGSGVIVATAFIHLLQPASEALGDPCLGGTFAEYPWAFGICLMSLFMLFFTEIVSHHFISKSLGDSHESHGGADSVYGDDDDSEFSVSKQREIVDSQKGELFIKDKFEQEVDLSQGITTVPSTRDYANLTSTELEPTIPGKDHFAHDTEHQDPSQLGTPVQEQDKEQYLNQIVAVTILEAGIIFHSVFVGLSLSVSGEEFETLFIVLTFHQMFEGLGLGTRVAETNWPENRKNTPWLMGLAFMLTSPIAVAIGIGVRHSWVPGSRKSLIANGVFDAISSGILIYTGLVELMAHEFLFSNQFKGPGGLKKMLYAYFIMCLGAGLMALLGKWA